MKSDPNGMKRPVVIRTPDHRLRVFVSSTLRELEAERKAVHHAITELHLAPVMFESGARPHPAQDLYQAYLSQSHIFIGIYWQSYGWVGPGMQVSGLEDEYNRSSGLPRLIYIKKPTLNQDPALKQMLDRIRDENAASYKYFQTPDELKELVENDLILLLTEYFETARSDEERSGGVSPSALTNVPIPRNLLIGREQELETACSLLLREDVGLVTLTGPAGTGKSRLGIQIALDLRDQFKDGVYLVVLESIRDPGLVITTIARTLNITETTGRLSLLEPLKSFMCGKQMLLLLDNFEHVLPAAPYIADLLEACPKIKILVTSRASLHLRAEKELPIQPLTVPPLGERFELQPLSQYSSVQLFIQRCQGVKADFQVTNKNASAIAEICHRLDGLPLAIELAAARIKLLPPHMLLSRLERRFEVLRGGTKDLPERQKTMYSAIDWSYNLLDENDKQLFRRLSVFNGGWTVDAAEAVCSLENQVQFDILDGLERLLDNNLLKSPDEEQSELRFKMLESIREFGHDRLLESGEGETIFQRHAQFFTSLAEQAENEKFGLEIQHGWRLRLEPELDNLRAAMSWALENGNHACALRIATGLWRFWWTHGSWQEGIQWMEHGLASSEPCPEEIRAKALTRMGWMLDKVGDNPYAIASLQEAEDLWRQIDDQAGLALALSNLGAIMLLVDPDKGIIKLEEALSIRRTLSDQRGVYATLMNLGLAVEHQGNRKRAVELFSESLEKARQVKDEYSMVITLINLGDTHTTMENYEQADQCFIEAEQIYLNLGNRAGLADVMRGRGRIALKLGDHAQALDLFSEACRIAYDANQTSLTLVVLEGIAFAAQKLGDSEQAACLLSVCNTLRERKKLYRIPSHQADYDAYINSSHAVLGEAMFAKACAQGSSMTLDQAVAYAIKR